MKSPSSPMGLLCVACWCQVVDTQPRPLLLQLSSCFPEGHTETLRSWTTSPVDPRAPDGSGPLAGIIQLRGFWKTQQREFKLILAP